MASYIARRKFLAALGGVAAGWPLAARAQQPPSAVRHIGVLSTGFSNADAARSFLDPFRQGLRELGWIEGQNVSIAYRFADGKPDLLPELASELIRLQSEVIVTEGSPATLAVKNASPTIAIVMGTSGDPVGSGLVASLNRPGGNVTGLALLSSDLAGKRLQLLAEIVPGLARVAALFNPTNPTGVMALEQTQSAAPSLNIEVQPVVARRGNEHGPRRDERGSPGSVHDHSGRYALWPAGASCRFCRCAAALVDKILRGTRPADLPVEQPAKLDLAINLKTAKALGLQIPDRLLALADEVIE